MDDPDFDPDEFPRRRVIRCQCDGESVGPCPGPLNCPYSGLGPEEEDEDD